MSSILQEDEKEREEGETASNPDVPVEMSAADKAIEARKREVNNEISESLKERSKEQDHLKQKVQEESFQALLVDLVKNPDISWHSAKKLLKADKRYDSLESMRKRVRERLFDEHMAHLEKRMKLKQTQEVKQDQETWSL